mmetsp:Transcript_5067/g.18776  ORF Transcript_5067/g.18776 Transcript_5067/m.18776 type:complete len:229 (-) Transcript_5067:2183-2869(-)
MAAGVELVGETDEISAGELERSRVLLRQLEDAVEELEEDGRALVFVPESCAAVAAAVVELVAEGQPFLLDQHREALEGAVVGVEEELCQRRELCSAVPAVGAVQHHRAALVHQARDLDGRLEQQLDEGQPARAVEGGVEALVVAARRLAEALEAVVAVAHDVDVVDVEELQPAVAVRVAAHLLVAHAEGGVCEGVGAWPRVEQMQDLAARFVRSTDRLHQLLVGGAAV